MYLKYSTSEKLLATQSFFVFIVPAKVKSNEKKSLVDPVERGYKEILFADNI